jgi:hypothetical protein
MIGMALFYFLVLEKNKELHCKETSVVFGF